eukprot:6244180-Amphidinium_carterae.4
MAYGNAAGQETNERLESWKGAAFECHRGVLQSSEGSGILLHSVFLECDSLACPSFTDHRSRRAVSRISEVRDAEQPRQGEPSAVGRDGKPLPLEFQCSARLLQSSSGSISLKVLCNTQDLLQHELAKVDQEHNEYALDQALKDCHTSDIAGDPAVQPRQHIEHPCWLGKGAFQEGTAASQASTISSAMFRQRAKAEERLAKKAMAQVNSQQLLQCIAVPKSCANMRHSLGIDQADVLQRELDCGDADAESLIGLCVEAAWPQTESIYKLKAETCLAKCPFLSRVACLSVRDCQEYRETLQKVLALEAENAAMKVVMAEEVRRSGGSRSH